MPSRNCADDSYWQAKYVLFVSCASSLCLAAMPCTARGTKDCYVNSVLYGAMRHNFHKDVFTTSTACTLSIPPYVLCDQELSPCSEHRRRLLWASCPPPRRGAVLGSPSECDFENQRQRYNDGVVAAPSQWRREVALNHQEGIIPYCGKSKDQNPHWRLSSGSHSDGHHHVALSASFSK